jgi:hypothetical protein
MMSNTQEQFRQILLMVVGQAFTAAGYALETNAMQQAGGMYRFVKTLPDGLTAQIDFQNLVYQDTEWSAGMPSRFRINLSRSDGRQRDLSALVVEDFTVPILPSARHWWSYRDANSLGQALAEAGRLAIGYGMPWLAGDLEPE